MTTVEQDKRVLRLHSTDNVGIACADLEPGITVSIGEDRKVQLIEQIARGHKFAAAAIPADAPIHKYGQVIGFAARDIAIGEHLHTHNVVFHGFDRDYTIGRAAIPTDFVPEADRATFQGYVRGDGRVGTRNYIVVLVSVNCSATAATRIATHFEHSGELDLYPDVDGVVALTHGYGRGTAGQGNEGFEILQRTQDMPTTPTSPVSYCSASDARPTRYRPCRTAGRSAATNWSKR